ncbi:MAG: PilZ domain-containing protein [Sulfobacillus sp.]
MSLLEANQTVQLVVRDRALGSRVLRRVRHELYIDALQEMEVEWTPMPGQAIQLRWVSEDTVWAQNADVLDVLDPVPIIVVQVQGSPTVVEFRGSLRIKVGIPIEYSLPRPGSEMFLTTTYDLSATGLKFPCAVQVWTGLQLRLILRVDGQEIKALGKVVWVSQKSREVRGRKSWETAVQFLQISTKERHDIDAYVTRIHLQRQSPRGG